MAAELAVLAAALLAAGSVAPALGPAVGRARSSLAAGIAPSASAMAAVVALVAMAGSLYFSEVAHFVPCRLCWYQRAAMYPIGPLLLVAVWRGWTRAGVVAIGLAVVGASISSYHVLLERYPTLETGVCDPENPCTLVWFSKFGYLTIPGMALSGFLLIITLLLAARARPAA